VTRPTKEDEEQAYYIFISTSKYEYTNSRAHHVWCPTIRDSGHIIYFGLTLGWLFISAKETWRISLVHP
jgi:hypothetical protein